jgi:hypothetical protein
LALIALLAAPVLCAAAEGVAATPPMGWNSWDCYGTTVTEAEVKANADYMAQHLKQHGWQYIVSISSGPSRIPRRTATARTRRWK